MKRQFQIVRHNPNEFNKEQLDSLIALISNEKTEEHYRGAQFIFNECVFEIVAIQTNFDLNKKLIAIGQISSKQKSVIHKPSGFDVAKANDNGG